MLRIALAGAALAATGLAAGPAAAQALNDKYWIEASAYFPGIDTQASVSRPGMPGTDVDLEKDFGLDKHETLPAFYLGARFGKRFQVTGEYYALDRHGTKTLSRDIVFDGATYPASVSLDSKLQSDVYRVTVGYAFLRNERGELGAAIGLHATDFDLSTKGQVRVGAGAGLQSENRRRNFVAPLPTLGVYGAYEATPKVILNGRVDFLSLKYKDYDGSIVNAQASIGYRVTDMFTVGAAYRYVSYDLDIEKKAYTAKLDYDFSGPSVFVRAGFR